MGGCRALCQLSHSHHLLVRHWNPAPIPLVARTQGLWTTVGEDSEFVEVSGETCPIGARSWDNFPNAARSSVRAVVPLVP